MSSQWMWRLVPVLCGVLGLSACGGGGGGGGSSPDSGGGGTPAVKVTSDRDHVDVVAFTGTGMPAQSIQVSLETGTGVFYGDVSSDHPDDVAVTFNPTGATATVTLALQKSADTPAVYEGNVLFRLCSDTDCKHVAWSQTYPYHYALFSVDLQALNFSAFEGAGAGSQLITVTPPDTTGLLTAAVSTAAAKDWLSVTRTPEGNFLVNVSAAGLGAGTYRDAVGFIRTNSPFDYPRYAPVTVTVGGGWVAPSAVNFDLLGETTALSGTAPLTFNGEQAPAWTAGSDQSWLVLDTPSGTGPGALRFHVDLASLVSVPNNSTLTAQVSLHAPNHTDVSFPVTVNKRLPELWSTSPVMVRLGQATSLRVFGRGLAQLSDLSRLQVAGVTGVTGTVVSDHEIVLNLPALSSPRTELSLSNAAGMATAKASIVAGPASTALAWPAGMLSNVGDKRTALFDPTRDSLFAINRSENTLVRFRLVAGAWAVTALPISTVGDMAMSPDSQTIYVASGTRTLLAVDPDTMAVRTRLSVPAELSLDLSAMRLSSQGLPKTANGRLWFGGGVGGLGYFDLKTQQFVMAGRVPMNESGRFVVPADGSVMYEFDPVGHGSAVYDPFTDTHAQPVNLPPAHYSIVYDGSGRRLLADTQSVYDGRTLDLVGSAGSALSYAAHAVMSPDGTRLYLQPSAGASGAMLHVDVYDTTRLSPGTGSLLPLGSIDLPAQAAGCTANGDYYCDASGLLVMHPMGDALFWIGNKGLQVIPLTGEFAGASASASRLARARAR